MLELGFFAGALLFVAAMAGKAGYYLGRSAVYREWQEATRVIATCESDEEEEGSEDAPFPGTGR